MKNKRCTVTQFARAMDLSGIRLSNDEVNEIAEYYGDSETVPFGKFCDEVNEVFNIKGLEQMPTSPVKLAMDGGTLPQLGLDNPSLNEEDVECLQMALNVLEYQVRTSGIVLKSFFVDFDHNNDGCITLAEFRRCLGQITPKLKPFMADVVAQAYTEDKPCQGVTFVNYRQLHLDVSTDLPAAPGLATSEPMRSGDTFVTPYWIHSQDIGAVEVEMSQLVSAQRLRVQEFFLEFDLMRSGRVLSRHFKQAVRRCFQTLPLTEEQLGGLAQKYAASGGMVQWDEFVGSIMGKVDASSELRRTGITAPPDGDTYSGATINGTDVTDLIISEIRDQVQARRIELKPVFQDFDKLRTEHVTRVQFGRVLSSYDLHPGTGSDGIDGLYVKYGATNAGTPRVSLSITAASSVTWTSTQWSVGRAVRTAVPRCPPRLPTSRATGPPPTENPSRTLNTSSPPSVMVVTPSRSA
mmetsp:Transcript_65328/g.181137  ORF Transcript_65328/g.181137 Transcript_65328/m.181137 type:complete len:465 (-) Transcript_65328:101-1495(-)